MLSGRDARPAEADGVETQGEDLKFTIRKYHSRDRAAVLAIAAESFAGVCLDENIEKAFGPVGADWREHKKDSVDYDLVNSPSDTLVAVADGEVIGFVCNRVYHSRSLGHVANLAVATQHQGKGVGKALMQATFAHFRKIGLQYARIETLEQNERGQKFYPSLGFQEIGRQIFYFTKL
jgi:ribosomal protein S18 acetylase RimI-like enzyme